MAALLAAVALAGQTPTGASVSALVLRARARLAAHQPAAALDLLEQARRLDPGAVQPLLGEGAVFLSLRMPDRAEARFRQAAQLQPASELAWKGLLDAQIRQSRWQDALQTDNQALRRWPLSRLFLYRRAVLLINLARGEDAVKQLDAIEQRWPHYAAAHYSAAVAADNQGRDSDALRELKTARRLAGDNGQIAFLEGIVEGKLHHPEAARAALERALRFRPSDPAIHRLLARVLLKLRQPSAARRQLAAASRLAHASVSTETLQARLLDLDRQAEQQAMHNQLAASLETYDAALRLDPRDVNALAGKAKVLYSLRRFPKAASLFGRAADERPGNDDLHFLYGLALSRLQQWTAARRELRLALALNPANQEARRLLTSLPARGSGANLH